MPTPDEGSPQTDAALAVRIARRLRGFLLDVAFSSGRETVVLFGPSGGGKSLTLKAIAGIVRPEAGRIEVGGRLLYDSDLGVNVPPHQRRVGYVPQGYALFPHLSVAENIAYGLRGLERGPRQDTVREMLALAGLAGLEERRTRQLSGGQQQRVALARALAVRPDILLLDEPFSALDAPMRRELRDEVTALQGQMGITMLIVTHDLADAFALGRRIVVIDSGRVLQEGSREDVFYRPATRRVAELVGMRNVFAASVVRVEEGTVRVDWEGRELEAALPAGSGGALTPGRPVNVCIRQTQIMIRRPDDAYTGRRNLLSGRIVDEIISAEDYRLFVSLRGSAAAYDLQIELPGYTYFRLGLDQNKEIEMSVRPEAVHLIPRSAEGASESS